jgi:hypothetical protein
MNVAVNFKFSCSCAGNLQGLMSVKSVTSESVSIVVSFEKLFIVFSYSSCSSNECYVSYCSQNSFWLAFVSAGAVAMIFLGQPK